MENAGVLEKLLTQTAPVTAFVVGLLFILYKLGTLTITKYFDKMVPLQERSVTAIEKASESIKDLAGSARQFAYSVERDLHAQSASLQALWDEKDGERKRREVSA